MPSSIIRKWGGGSYANGPATHCEKAAGLVLRLCSPAARVWLWWWHPQGPETSVLPPKASSSGKKGGPKEAGCGGGKSGHVFVVL